MTVTAASKTAPPIHVAPGGTSPNTIQTHNGPSTVSSSINDAAQYLRSKGGLAVVAAGLWLAAAAALRLTPLLPAAGVGVGLLVRGHRQAPPAEDAEQVDVHDVVAGEEDVEE